MVVDTEALLTASREAQTNLRTALIEIFSLFEALRQYRLPDVASEGVPDSHGESSRRLSVIEMSEDGQKSTQELNTRISRHLDAYEKATDQLKKSVARMNEAGAGVSWLQRTSVRDRSDIPWMYSRMTDMAGESSINRENMVEYEQLLAEKALLVEQVSQRNSTLQYTIEQLRDLSFIMSSLVAR